MVPNHQPAILAGPDRVRCFYLSIYCLAPQNDAACSSSVSAKKKTASRSAGRSMSRENHGIPWLQSSHFKESLTQILDPKDSWWVQYCHGTRRNASAFRKTAELGSHFFFISLHCLIFFGSSGISKRWLFWCLLLTVTVTPVRYPSAALCRQWPRSAPGWKPAIVDMGVSENG